MDLNWYYHSWSDLALMVMKGYSILPRSQGLEPHHQIQFSAIPRTLPFFFLNEMSYSSAEDTAYSKPHQQQSKSKY